MNFTWEPLHQRQSLQDHTKEQPWGQVNTTMLLDVSHPPSFSVTEDQPSMAGRWKKWVQAFKFYVDVNTTTSTISDANS